MAFKGKTLAQLDSELTNLNTTEATYISGLETLINTVSGDSEDLVALKAEHDSDTTRLDGRIDSENAARLALEGRLDSEIIVRAMADSELEAKLDSEIMRLDDIVGGDGTGVSNIADNAVDTDAIADGAVTNDKIANAFVDLGIGDASESLVFPNVRVALGGKGTIPPFDGTTTGVVTPSFPDVLNSTEEQLVLGKDSNWYQVQSWALNSTEIIPASRVAQTGTNHAITITGTGAAAARTYLETGSSRNLAVTQNDTFTVTDADSDTYTFTYTGSGVTAMEDIPTGDLTQLGVVSAYGVQSGGGLNIDGNNDFGISTGGVDSDMLASDSVTTAKLAADAVTNAKLADNAVNTENLTGVNSTSEGFIRANGSGSFNVTTNQQIQTSELADNAVTAAKIDTDSVAGENLITAVGSAPGFLKLTNGGQIEVTSEGTITNADLGTSAVGEFNIANDSIRPTRLKTDGNDGEAGDYPTFSSSSEFEWKSVAEVKEDLAINNVQNVDWTSVGTEKIDGSHQTYGTVANTAAEGNSVPASGTVPASWDEVGGSIEISEAAPSNPNDGDLWYDSGVTFRLYFYDEGSGSWVDASPAASPELDVEYITEENLPDTITTDTFNGHEWLYVYEDV